MGQPPDFLIPRCTSPASSIDDHSSMSCASDSDSGMEMPFFESMSSRIKSQEATGTKIDCKAVRPILDALVKMARDDRPAFRKLQKRLDVHDGATTEQLAKNLAHLAVARPDGRQDDFTRLMNPDARDLKPIREPGFTLQ